MISPTYEHLNSGGAGVDEVGRGPLAGPVIAVALILNIERLPLDLHQLIDDSKKLSHKRRLFIKDHLVSYAHIGVGQSSVKEIDQINILQATFLAMRRAVDQLPIPPSHVWVDGTMDPHLPYPSTLIRQGDQTCLSIAAASIVAKVIRDALMEELHIEYPLFSWNKNKGYGTAEHRKALNLYGPTSHHRMSFAPCRRD